MGPELFSEWSYQQTEARVADFPSCKLNLSHSLLVVNSTGGFESVSVFMVFFTVI